MVYEDLYSSFIDNYNAGDKQAASIALLRELGNILVKRRDDFVYLLNESEIPATADMTDAQLVDLFIENIGKNQKLTLGSSLLVNMQNANTGFDGEVDDDAVKAGYSCLMSCFDANYDNAAGAIAGAVQGVAQLGATIAQGQQKRKYGATDLATQKEQGRAAITQQIIAQRQAQIEAAQKEKETQSKTVRTILIVGGVIVGLAVLGSVIYMIRKKN